jgi:hypothetical protein
MKLFLPMMLASALLAQNVSPTGNRITPPTIASVSPQGVPRGLATEIVVEGFNLAGATKVLFSEPGVTGKILQIKELPDVAERRLGSNGTESTIDLGPLPPRNRLRIELEVSGQAPVAPVDFRIVTPLGTSPVGRFLIEPFWGEVGDAEPNDTFANATDIAFPAVLAGAISRNGDIDTYKFRVRAGEQVVFDNGGMDLGSSLQPLYRIFDSQQNLIREWGKGAATERRSFAHTFGEAGEYYLQISDFTQAGRGSSIYRLKAGAFPLVTGVFPLGFAPGGEKEVEFSGYNLGASRQSVKAVASAENEFRAIHRMTTPAGPAFNEVEFDLGKYPELTLSKKSAEVTIPATVNGRLEDEITLRFRAQAGEEIVAEVLARRAGVDLDSVIEILDEQGQPVEMAVLRPVWETTVTLRDHDSVGRGIRLNAWGALEVGDYLQIGSEVIRLEELPRGPDDDTRFFSLGGQRLAYFNTSPEAHAIDSAVYKVQIHPAGTQFSPNGLPLTRLYARNDDGGPGYGKDSLLRFVAPRDGIYQLKLTDTRGKRAVPQAFRLTLRNPEPDYRLSFSPANPNLPAQSAIPVTVNATRLDGFEGAINLSVEGLPPGVSASPATILPGQTSAVILLKSGAGAPPAGEAFPIQILGTGVSNRGTTIRHRAMAREKLAVLAMMPQPDIRMTTLSKVLEIEAGSTVDVRVALERLNGFGGRVPVAVLNLPPTVRVLDVGLNGVLLNEDETERGFTLAALPSSDALEQVIYIAGQVETRSPQQNLFAAPEAVLLRVKSRPSVSSTGSISGQIVPAGGGAQLEP